MRRARTAGTLLACLAMLVALGSPVEAQSRHGSRQGRSNTGRSYRAYRAYRTYRTYRGPSYRRPSNRRFYRPVYRRYYRPTVRFYGYLGYPYYPYYSPYYYGSAFGAYGDPYAYYPGSYYPYYGYGPARGWASVRIEVKPRQAKVYVDGYYAGVVDDYDGTFQRLNVPAGNHEITVYLEGFGTIQQTLYLSPDNSYKIKQEMVPLAPGERQDPPPQPPEPLEQEEEGIPGMELPGATTPEGQVAPPLAPPRARAPEPPMPSNPPPAMTSTPTSPSDFGVVEVRVQPQGVRLLIDGEPWPIADPSAPISIHVSQGRHHVEIEKEGYRSFSGDVVVSSGRTTTLNVKLSSATERPDGSPLSISRMDSR